MRALTALNDRMGGTDEKFLAVYPDADKMSLSLLLKVIRARNPNIQHRRSKNGSYEDRKHPELEMLETVDTDA